MTRRGRRRTLPEQLRSAIKASGLSQNALAKLADVPQPVLWRFASGGLDLRLETADKLCAALGLELKKS